jgi:hypothetical protein
MGSAGSVLAGPGGRRGILEDTLLEQFVNVNVVTGRGSFGLRRRRCG